MLFLSLMSVAQIKVAVIDTGLDYKLARDIPICKSGHIGNFRDDWNPKHGTNVSGLINNHAKKTHYCQVILQVFDKKRKNNISHVVNAIKQSIKLKVDVINMSFGSIGFDQDEQKAVISALNNGITVVAASGNESMKLTNTNCFYFPACYDKRIIVVGGNSSKANYGEEIIDYTENSLDQEAYGISLSGTSQAAAIRTGKIIKELGDKRVFERRK